MQAVFPVRAGCFGLLCIALVSCDEAGTPFGAQSFQEGYVQARSALEGGDLTRAERGYARLMGQGGTLGARLRLEYAHVLLRQEDYARASAEARTAGQTLTDAGQAAALAVQATADHEIGLAALKDGQTDTGAQFLRQADTAMAQVLKKHPKLDPQGALAARRASIKVRLKGL